QHSHRLITSPPHLPIRVEWIQPVRRSPLALRELYGGSLALLTDLYQLTMAYGYWKLGMADREAVFCLQFRKNPFGGGYTVACGLHAAIEFVNLLRFDPSDLDYLSGLRGH